MRSLLVSLSAFALVAVANADGSNSTVTSDLTVTLLSHPNVDLLSVVSQSFHIGSDGNDFDSSDTLGGALTATQSGSTSFGGDGITTFHAVATATATLDSPNYAAVPDVFPDYGYNIVGQGARFYLSMINRTEVDQTVTFHVKISESTVLHAGGPYGPGLFDDDGNPITPGGYAQGDLSAGLIDRSSAYDVDNDPNERFPDYNTSLNGSGVAVSDFTSSGAVDEFDVSYVIPERQSHLFQLNSVATASLQFTPVPEPSAFAALGLGTIAILRRRRSARA